MSLFILSWKVRAFLVIPPPGGSAVLEFNEMPVKSIKITIDAKEESILALNEIVVPRALGGNGWDFENNEITASAPDISYTNGNTVKLAVLRQGAKFYFLCNDAVMIESSNFALFGDLQRAGVGFLTFNSPIKISNYSATADEAKIAEKLAQYVNH